MVDIGWPTRCPDVPPSEDGWFDEKNQDFLSLYVTEGDTVIEIGSWMGLSTRWLARKVGEQGHVFAIDNFKGSREHQHDPKTATKLPRLWESFISSCWHMKDRITPVRGDSHESLLYLHGSKIRLPDLVYVDGSHDYDDVVKDLILSMFIWPTAKIVGDDFELSDVERAAVAVANLTGKRLLGNKRCYTFR
jgi:Methyltransferase domain